MRGGIPAAAALLIGAIVLVTGTVALAGSDSLRDPRGDTKALRAKPEIDIVRVSAADESGGRVKFKIAMHGRLKPEKKNTRPFILINTKGGGASDFEYLVLGPRVFKVVGKKYLKVGANKFIAGRSTWIYRWKPASIALGDGDSFGWAILTAKGNTVDLAPEDRYRDFEIETIPAA